MHTNAFTMSMRRRIMHLRLQKCANGAKIRKKQTLPIAISSTESELWMTQSKKRGKKRAYMCVCVCGYICKKRETKKPKSGRRKTRREKTGTYVCVCVDIYVKRERQKTEKWQTKNKRRRHRCVLQNKREKSVGRCI